MAKHNETGKQGEKVCEIFLVNNGFTIIKKNFRVQYGELDIIAEKDNILRFIEVKTISVRDLNKTNNLSVTPEDNLTNRKWENIIKTIELFLYQNTISHETPFQIDLACIYLQETTRQAKVVFHQNIHKE